MLSLKSSARIGGVASGRAWPRIPALRALATVVLRSASALLAAWADRLAGPPAPLASDSARHEFYAQAGAPEGALYVDGKLVGFLPGVQRL